VLGRGKGKHNKDKKDNKQWLCRPLPDPSSPPPTHMYINSLTLTHTHTHRQTKRQTQSAYTKENRFSRKRIVRTNVSRCTCVSECFCVWVCVLCKSQQKIHTLNKIWTKGFFQYIHIHTYTCISEVKFGTGSWCVLSTKKEPKNTQISSYLSSRPMSTLIFCWPNICCCLFVQSAVIIVAPLTVVVVVNANVAAAATHIYVTIIWLKEKK